MRTPLCPYFGKCGGCDTQHVEYELQLDNKKKRLAQLIGREDIQVFSDNEWNYRSRMDFVFYYAGLGLREKGRWWSKVDIANCVISNDPLNMLLAEVREHFKGVDAFDARKFIGTYKYAVIRTPRGDSSISFVLNEESPKLGDALDKIRNFADVTTANNVLVTYMPPKTDQSIGSTFEVIKGSDELNETLMGKKFRYSIQGFFQNNPVMAEKLQEYVYGLLKAYPTSDAHLLDLYGGVGTFGIINAPLFKTALTVESVPECTASAEKNIGLNDMVNIKAVCVDAKKIKTMSFPAPLFVLTDPPRAGMHPDTIVELRRIKPKVIIYVSCNPEQLGKDLPKFEDYKLKSAAMFDLFPQTNHMEAVVELVLKQ